MSSQHTKYTRRHFIEKTALTSIGLTLLLSCNSENKKGNSSNKTTKTGSLNLIPDPKGYLDLPEGFQYKIISQKGNKMSDGFLVPGRPDGMGTFLDESGKTIIIRNHENSPIPLENSPFGNDNKLFTDTIKDKLYDAGNGAIVGLGGTTTLVYDEQTGNVVDEFMSLAGTYRNCAGGITPWGSWITCEEDVTMANGNEIQKNHGYVFEVPMNVKEMITPVPIKDMGRFNHEAVAVDPKSGCIYLTEDRPDGLLYRFIPNEKENLQKGGKLEVLAITAEKSLDTRNWESPKILKNKPMEVYWIPIDNVDPKEDDLRFRGFELGAARFARGEGIWMGENELYFACTNGGPNHFGQVFRYKLSKAEGTSEEANTPATLELYAESEDKTVLHMCDNLNITPWGDLFLCEDNGELNHIRGIDKQGNHYTFACNKSSTSELTGLTFSPTGKTLFVNVQESGHTLAITGPWEKFI
ncbi:alkaline phosphatase PhoX [Tenacibaculum sp. M341]|uniref:alkaline phosphatase PhoX n=1 Tax=Tenacibaculum sp. M341 TaxID=2530339 RepID=UPI00104A5CFA|nr:alkaline phosphatase PhoX [Tenacibaculum sp. M341]TCI91361.1 DUF839 domain-containing protein [Tenacibaculum sp. M341]